VAAARTLNNFNMSVQCVHSIALYTNSQVAAGHKLPAVQSDIVQHGHAIEARVYAENHRGGFLPTAGPLLHLQAPTTLGSDSDGGVRVDTGVRAGDQVSMFYDPMIAKVIAYGADRQTALSKMNAALEQYQIVGVPTNVDFLVSAVSHAEFARGAVDTGFIDVRLHFILNIFFSFLFLLDSIDFLFF
jgi:3-methylcrotonyl-CoA carboxylase alpha subunit